MQTSLDFGDKGDSERLASDNTLKQWPPETATLASPWRACWVEFASSASGIDLIRNVSERQAAGACIYPVDPLRALRGLSLDAVRVVILGQDPYHGPGQAEGLAFSVPAGVKIPPSLRNIFKEIQRERGGSLPQQGHLGRWAAQGVLLLNTTLTVEGGLPASHARMGWALFTDRLIQCIASRAQPLVFMLWGAHAQGKRSLIAAADPEGRHQVLMANHPSPLSAMRPPWPFMGCGHFSQANAFLRQNAQTPIVW